MRGNEFTLKHEGFRLNIKKNFLNVGVVGLRNELPRCLKQGQCLFWLQPGGPWNGFALMLFLSWGILDTHGTFCWCLFEPSLLSETLIHPKKTDCGASQIIASGHLQLDIPQMPRLLK